MASTTLPSGAVGVDYSFSRPSPTTMKKAGVQFVSRYLATGSTKVIDSSERDSLFAAGLTILLNWEQSSGDFLVPSKGSSQGAEAAKQASALGYPTGGASGGTSTGAVYTVKAGDSWWGIAESQLGSGDTELAAYNAKTMQDVIHPGDVLKIPST